jgi:hypothetical protein
LLLFDKFFEILVSYGFLVLITLTWYIIPLLFRKRKRLCLVIFYILISVYNINNLTKNFFYSQLKRNFYLKDRSTMDKEAEIVSLT